MTVTLSWPECELAAWAGVKRRLLALHDKRPGFYGFKEKDAWGSDIESCASELAVAKHYSLFWVPWRRRPDRQLPDVGKRIQVRHRSQHGWSLIVHPDDLDEHFFVLTTGALPAITIVGWLPGAAAKAQRYWGDPYSTKRPAFWIPQADLNDPTELREE